MLPLALLPLLFVMARPGPDIRGTVSEAGGGDPVENVLVELLDEPRRAWSDSLGEYALKDVSAGGHRLRFSRLGYETLEVDVVVSIADGLRLDVSLAPRPIAMRGVGVDTRSARRGARVGGNAADAGLELGLRRVSPLDRDPLLAERDPLRALAAYPDVAARPELATGLHVRGGSADQNAILLDGLPIYSPYHTAGELGAVNPDAVAKVSAHSGVLPARLGGALSSVVEIETRSAAAGVWESRGGVEPREIRQTVELPLPAGTGALMVAGRRRNRDAFSGEGGSPTSGFGDLLAKLTLRLPAGDLEALSFTSGDRLTFDSVVDPEDLAPGVRAEQVGSPAPAPLDGGTENRLRWSGGTQGLVWRSRAEGPASLEARAWRSEADATARWIASSGRLRLASGRDELGLAGLVRWPLASGQAEASLGLQRTATRYHLRDDSGGEGDGPPPGLDLTSAPTVLSASFDQAWPATGRWGFTTGVRTELVPGSGLFFEPRSAARLAVADGLVASFGYARTHQFVQSLRNEESILDALFGMDLPIAAGDGAPVARSDQLTGAVEARRGTVRLAADGYVRWLDGLVLVAPVTSQPFATQGFEVGTGRAWGLDVVVERQGSRFRAQAAYGLSRAVRRAGGLTYHPSFDRAQFLSLAMGYRLLETTWLRAALLASSGSPTTPLAQVIVWDSPDPLGSQGEFAGTPERTTGPLNAARLPAYVRLDLGVRHDWALRLGSRPVLVTGFLDFHNVLDRANLLGYFVSPAAATHPLSLLPRGLTFGLEWRY